MSVVAIIDDSLTIRKIVEVTFAREGCQVLSFGNGMAALRALTAPGAAWPSVIFVDFQLPGMNGLQVVRLLRQRPAFAQTRLVLLSRRYGVVDWLLARLAGVDAYLIKPVRTQDLLAQAMVVRGRV
ncbi:MAG TPA: response regulator [Ktedonobacteraceae bacterium]|nr:response regulator [Ktedonobacteraceae bacterium]